jgi:hypothetical protein
LGGGREGRDCGEDDGGRSSDSAIHQPIVVAPSRLWFLGEGPAGDQDRVRCRICLIHDGGDTGGVMAVGHTPVCYLAVGLKQ